jgi:hypothetical protein
MWRSTIFAAAMLLFLSGVAAGQSALSGLHAGDRVRLRADGVRGQFDVAEMSASRLLLRQPESGQQIDVPTNSIQSLHVRGERRPRGGGALRGLGFGLLVGGGGGAIIGYASGDDDPGFLSFSAEEKALMGAVAFGGIGAVLGAVMGAAAPGYNWHPVVAPVRVNVAPLPDGRVSVGFTQRF